MIDNKWICQEFVPSPPVPTTRQKSVFPDGPYRKPKINIIYKAPGAVSKPKKKKKTQVSPSPVKQLPNHGGR